MKDSINVGLFGLGTVGMGVVRLLSKNRAIIEKRVGKPVHIAKAVVLNPKKDRGMDLSEIKISKHPKDILDDPEMDIVLEMVGGLDAAEQIILRALEKGKSVITANKALLAEKGRTLFPAAHDAAGCFGFESSVGTAIPIIRTLKESFAGDNIQALSGIINGTSNYILTRMTRDGVEFKAALTQAQTLGLAEPDPFLDIQGIDAAHKLIIMMNIAFNGVFDFSELYTEGISAVTAADIHYTDQLGYTIKHMGKAGKTDQGIEARVHPVLVKKDHLLASVNGAFNAISVTGEFMGPSILYGLGAGPGPSAVGVVGDLIEACRYLLTGQRRPISPFSIPLKHWLPIKMVPMAKIRTEYYLRFPVLDRLGVLAHISNVLADHRISVRSVIQEGKPGQDESPVDIVIMTHEAIEADVQNALGKINGQSFIAGPARLIRIEPDERPVPEGC